MTLSTRVLDLGWRADSRSSHVKENYRSKLEIPSDLPRSAHFDDKRGSSLALQFWQVYEPNKDFHACAASAVASAIEACADRNGVGQFRPSVRFIYYIGRYLQNREAINEGVSIYSCLRACHAMGFCAEDYCPTLGDNVNTPPTREAFEAAKENGIVAFEYCYREPDVEYAPSQAITSVPKVPPKRALDVLKANLASGSPVIFGMLVDQPYLDGAAKGAIIPAPTDRLVDRHCALLVAYDDDGQYFTVRDSLGSTHGDNGYVKLAYDYIADTSLTNDFWAVRSLGKDGTEPLSGKRKQYMDDAREVRNAVLTAYRLHKGLPPAPPIVDDIELL